MEEMDTYLQLKSILEQTYTGDFIERAEQQLQWECGTVFVKSEISIFSKCRKILENWKLDCSEISNRGNLGGSITAYLMGVSEIDPIAYSLYPEFTFGVNGKRMPDLELNIPNHLIEVVQRIQTGGAQIKLIPHQEMEHLYHLSKQMGIALKDVPCNEPEVLAFFTEKKGGLKKYCKDSIPELAEASVREMIEVFKPKNFAHFCKILGLYYKTGLWKDNREKLVKEGRADIDAVISCREDIFEYCLMLGIDRDTAYQITENVRMGRVFRKKCSQWEDWKRMLLERSTPEWFVHSCELTEYLFPRAHLVSYMRMHMRMGWFLLHYS